MRRAVKRSQVGRGIAVAVLLGTLVGCPASPKTPPMGSPNTSPDQGGPPVEVAVVATQHFITDMPEGFTPAHLRVLLDKIKPDVLGVEAPANVPDPWQLAPLELARVTKPWAESRKVRVVPIGWHEPNYNAQLGQMFQAFGAGSKAAEYQAVEARFQARSAEQPLTCQFMNSATGHGLWRDYHAGLHNLYGKSTPWEDWNAKILGQVLQVCRENRGKRVAVIMGGAHGYYLLDHLAKSPDVRVMSVEELFPLDEQAVREQTTPKDYLGSLRLLNFPALGPALLPKLEAQLKKLEGVKELENDYHLFRGKLRLHQGQFRDALADFQKLASLDDSALSAFDGTSRLKEAGRVYVAIAKHRTGDATAARKELKEILNDPAVTEGTKQWARMVLESIVD